MLRFEYKVLDVPYKIVWWGSKINYQELSNKLNDLSKEGWEVTSSVNANAWRSWYTGLIIILKRQISK